LVESSLVGDSIGSGWMYTARNEIHRELKTEIRCLYAKEKE
jgi:hypothetical protein